MHVSQYYCHHTIKWNPTNRAHIFTFIQWLQLLLFWSNLHTTATIFICMFIRFYVSTRNMTANIHNNMYASMCVFYWVQCCRHRSHFMYTHTCRRFHSCICEGNFTNLNIYFSLLRWLEKYSLQHVDSESTPKNLTFVGTVVAEQKLENNNSMEIVMTTIGITNG